MTKKPAVKKPAKTKKPTKKKTTTKKPKTYVCIALDSSGSMRSIREAALDHFNEQVESIKKNAKDQIVNVTLVTFNDEVQTHFYCDDIDTLKKLDLADYNPNGMTSLYDAMGLTIEKLEIEPEIKSKEAAVLFVVVSDGEENSSRTYAGELGRERLQSKIKTLTDSGSWTFCYLGANQDVTKVAMNLSIPVNNVSAFTADPLGMATATTTQCDASGTYMTQRSAGVMSVTSFYSQDDLSKKSTT